MKSKRTHTVIQIYNDKYANKRFSFEGGEIDKSLA